MARRPAQQIDTKSGKLDQQIRVKALPITQGNNTFFVFVMDAKLLWEMASISRRHDTKDEGYQRVLSNSRVDAASRFIQSGEPIPNSILLALEGTHYDNESGELCIPQGQDIGWVIDGQHRLAAAHLAAEAGHGIQLCVVAFLDVDIEFQISQFITINKEAKGVPTSLLYSLLRHLPGDKKPAEVAQELATDIANELRRRKTSPLRDRIVITTSPKKGSQISITNFVRKIAPLVHPERGLLRFYTLNEQIEIIDIYFSGIKEAFSEQWKTTNNVFFQTIGFGAMTNVFEEVFQTILGASGRFHKKDVVDLLESIGDFNFRQWTSYGSGNKAELQAAQDIRVDLHRARLSSDGGKRIDLG